MEKVRENIEQALELLKTNQEGIKPDVLNDIIKASRIIREALDPQAKYTAAAGRSYFNNPRWRA